MFRLPETRLFFRGSCTSFFLTCLEKSAMIEDAYILFLKHGDFSLPSSHYFGDVLFFGGLLPGKTQKIMSRVTEEAGF